MFGKPVTERGSHFFFRQSAVTKERNQIARSCPQSGIIRTDQSLRVLADLGVSAKYAVLDSSHADSACNRESASSR